MKNQTDITGKTLLYLAECIAGMDSEFREKLLTLKPEFFDRVDKDPEKTTEFELAAIKDLVDEFIVPNRANLFKSSAPSSSTASSPIGHSSYRSGSPSSSFSSSSPISTGGRRGGDGCFIATAAYGSPLSEEVETLKNFRDSFLLQRKSGKALVSLYYRYSPRLADFISKHELFKKGARIGLYPVVGLTRWLVKNGGDKK